MSSSPSSPPPSALAPKNLLLLAPSDVSTDSMSGLSIGSGGCSAARSRGGDSVHCPYAEMWSSMGEDSQIFSLGMAVGKLTILFILSGQMKVTVRKMKGIKSERL